MEGHASKVTDSLASGARRKLLVVVMLAVMLALAVGHLYAISGLTDVYLGLPLWIWLQLVALAVLLALARATLGLVTAGTDGGR